jgi:hypothetical protein
MVTGAATAQHAVAARQVAAKRRNIAIAIVVFKRLSLFVVVIAWRDARVRLSDNAARTPTPRRTRTAFSRRQCGNRTTSAWPPCLNRCHARRAP